MIRFLNFLFAVVILGAILGAPHAIARMQADIYLLRGLNNVYSKGMDQIAAKMKQRGISANVINHVSWRSALAQIVANRQKFGKRRVILMGHSLGGNAAVSLARALQSRRIPVDYLVTFDATNPSPIPSNVRSATNYFQSNGSFGERLQRGSGFRGRLRNIDLANREGVGHFNIEKQPDIHRKIIGTTQSLLRRS